MRRALDLAALGKGQVSPNPMVGCVIVKDDKVIGEGYHEKYGGPHAEVNAVRDAGEENVKGATVYVTLEPCSHYGKTPPCADMLARLQPQKVIVSKLDPNPLVAGRGMKKLNEAGITTEVGLLEDEASKQNRAFFTFMNKKRPFVLLKWAQTADGFIARENYDSKWISSEASRKRVHEWRAAHDAIMVGTNTALHDNPSLNIRFDIAGKNPIRIVIDKQLTLPQTHHLFDQTQETLCYNMLESKKDGKIEYIKLKEEALFPQILNDLYERKVLSLIVEGGAYLLNELIARDQWDEAKVFVSEKTFDKGIAAPKITKPVYTTEEIASDELLTYHNF